MCVSVCVVYVYIVKMLRYPRLSVLGTHAIPQNLHPTSDTRLHRVSLVGVHTFSYVVGRVRVWVKG